MKSVARGGDQPREGQLANVARASKSPVAITPNLVLK